LSGPGLFCGLFSQTAYFIWLPSTVRITGGWFHQTICSFGGQLYLVISFIWWQALVGDLLVLVASPYPMATSVKWSVPSGGQINLVAGFI
jgi:hypothetical protein